MRFKNYYKRKNSYLCAVNTLAENNVIILLSDNTQKDKKTFNYLIN